VRVGGNRALEASAERLAPADRDLPAELAALAGTYAAWNPWLPQVVVSGWPFNRVG
jgi:hypothetical protein